MDSEKFDIVVKYQQQLRSDAFKHVANFQIGDVELHQDRQWFCSAL